MTCYATNGAVSRANMSIDPAWISISEEQYRQALVGMQEGKIVSIENGFEVLAPPEPEFIEPEEMPPQYPIFVGNQKLDLFTRAEQLAVVEATMTDPMVKLMYDRLLGAAYLAYEDAETEQGLQLLVDKGLLTVARKAEIVARMTGQEI